MQQRLNRLNELLLEEIQLHEALEAQLETEAARDGELDGATLLRIQQSKNSRVREIKKLEAERLALVEELAAAWGEDAEQLTLRLIIPRAPVELGESLRRCHGQLMELVNRIRALAAVTAGNAQARLKAVNATLAIINDAVKMHPTYSEAGKLRLTTPTFKQTSA